MLVFSLFELSLLPRCTVQILPVAKHTHDASLTLADLALEIPGFISPSAAGTRLQVRSRQCSRELGQSLYDVFPYEHAPEV